jgi:hypothetical protein
MALWPSPWAAEDGGPRRSQAPRDKAGLAIQPGERLICAARRDAFATTMVVLREPGQVYVLRHSLGRHPQRDPCVAWVERIDPRTLATLERSPELEAGPFWPGGMLAHATGSLYVTFGRFCHRLSDELEILARAELPQPRPYNSLVVLGDGTLAMKDLDRSGRAPAKLSLLDPETLQRCCPDVELPEAVVARLSAQGDRVYAVGVSTVYGYAWDGESLEPFMEVPYLDPGQSYGWDPVIEGGHLWFMDNGEHRYSSTMLGAGVAPGPVHLIRVSLSDPSDRESLPVGSGRRGAITDPPLYDPERRIALAYDSANAVVAAFRFADRLEPLWERRLAHSAHMIRYPDTGEVVLHDWSGPWLARSRFAHALGERAGWIPRRPRLRAIADQRARDDVVVIDLESGQERARASVPTMFQSVLFPAVGWERDIYWCTFSTLARLEVVSG